MRILKIRRVNSFLVGIMLIAIGVFCSSSQVQADAGEYLNEGDYTYTVTDGKARITMYNTNVEGDVTIPSTLGGFPVIGIGSRAFAYCAFLTGINIPQGVTGISDWAFYFCTDLTGITIPESVTSIGVYAFDNCPSLTTIRFNSATTKIYDDDGTIPEATKIIGYASSTAQDYATKYNRTFEAIGSTNTLRSIAITTPATKLRYSTGDTLDISGLVVTGTYSASSPKRESITAANVTGFNSAVAATDQVLTITVSGKTVTYKVQIVAAPQDKDYDYTVTGGKTKITNYTGSGGVVTIPSTLGGATVTSIGDSAFRRCTELTSISIPQGVTSIGTSAFAYCSGLTTISIPQEVTSIGNTAFYYCTGLTSIRFNSATTTIYDSPDTIPAATKIIGYNPSTAKEYATKYNRMFEGIGTTNTLQSIAITTPATKLRYTVGDTLDISGLVVTGTYSASSPKRESITAANVTGFNSAVAATDQVLTITVSGKTVTYKVQIVAATQDEDYEYTVTGGEAQIKKYTGAQGAVTIPSILGGATVTSIGDWAFDSSTDLTSISLPEGVISIGIGAFSDCTGLTSISIPQGVIDIGDFAFEGCKGLIAISLPESVTSIGILAFDYCTGLTSIRFNSASTEIYDSPETIPAATKIVGYDPSTAKEYATKYNRMFEGIGTTNTLQSIAITTPATKLRYTVGDALDISGLVVTGTYSFGSPKAESITAANVTGFNSAVAATDQVLTITVSGKTVTYKVQIVAALQNGDFTYTVTAGEAQITKYTGAGGVVTIPSTLGGAPVTSIGPCAFYDCYRLTIINIPQGVTSIGYSAFSGCISLTTISIPQGVTSIGNLAFYDCTGLTSISISQGVISIGDWAFKGCTSLITISIPQGVTSTGAWAFRGCKGLTTIRFNSATTTIFDFADTIPEATKIVGYDPSTAKEYATKYNRTFEAIGTTNTLQSIAITTPATKLRYTVGDTLDISGLVVTGTYSASSPKRESITAANVTGFNSAVAATDQVLTITVSGKTVTYKVQIVVADPQDSDYEYTVTGGKTQITNYTGSGGVVTIPSTLGGFPVTSIGNSAFRRCTDLTSISIPEGVTIIGTSAFAYCSGLTIISIPQRVTNIGLTAFYYCTGLTSIRFNSASTTIYDSPDTIPAATKIIGYNPSTAKEYATEYNRMFEVIGTTNTLQSIAITTPATKLRYTVGDTLDISGLVVTGTYNASSPKRESITAANVTGFNSAVTATDQVLTITVSGKTVTYKVQIVADPITPDTSGMIEMKTATPVVGPSKVWTIKLNGLIDDRAPLQDKIYITNSQGARHMLQHFITLENGIAKIVVKPAENYTPGDYILWVRDIEALNGMELKNQVYLKFTVVEGLPTYTVTLDYFLVNHFVTVTLNTENDTQYTVTVEGTELKYSERRDAFIGLLDTTKAATELTIVVAKK